MPNPGPFIHPATNRQCWWSNDRQCYVFGDNTPVPGQASAVQSPGNVQRNAPPGDGPSRAPNLSPSSETPRYVPPSNSPPTVIYAGPSQDVGARNVRINWKDWWQGQRFREGDTIRIQAGNGDPPFSFRQHLGSGSFATVLEVQVLGTTSVCALKIYKSRPTSAFDPFREKFENEIHNMREVSNRHIASFFGAYICERENKPPEFGIFMQPVADGGTLEFVISRYRAFPAKFTKQHKDFLAKAFGCLSSALEFVHRHMIRHKDVKSDNILMHGGKVLLTDFGSSWAGIGDVSLVTNNANPQGHTPRYAAPEVIKREPRSAKSDIFSLGGVFYEILVAIEPKVKWHEEEYWRISNTLRNGPGNWKNALPEVTRLIARMLDPSPEGRPSAHDLVDGLAEKYFCDDCCLDRRRNPSTASGSGTAIQPDQVAAQMARMSVHSNPRTVAGPSHTSAPSAVPRSSGMSGLPGTAGSSARRGSAPTYSVSQGPPRSYGPRPQMSATRRAGVEEEDDEDSSGDETE